MFESKINRGKAGGYAPLDSSGKVPSDKLPPIQSTIDTGSFAITGSNTFVGDQTVSGSITTTTGIVQGTGSLYLQPDSNDARYFQIYNTSPSDTHIKASGGLSYFGDDTNYLLIDDGTDTVTVAAFGDIILDSDDGGVYVGSNNAGNGIVTDGYLSSIIGDTNMVNNGTGNTITDNLTNIINSIPAAVDTGSFATTGSNSFTGSQSITGSLNVNGNQSITGSLNVNGPVTIAVTDGAVTGVTNWNGQGGWNQGSYTNITGSGGTGTGLTVDVSGGGGYIAIGDININNPGTGYTNGDVITINNENNLPGTFAIEVTPTNVLQCDINGNLILNSNNAPTSLNGSVGDVRGTLKIDDNSIYFATQSYAQTTFYVNGYADGTHVIVPIAEQDVPNIQSTGWTITINGEPYDITGAYPPDGSVYWYLEFDNLNTSIYTGTQLMTLVNEDYERHEIWGKIDFGFEKNKFVENAATSSIVKRVTVPTSLTGSEGDKNGMIAFDSGAIYFANDSYYGVGPFTSSLYQDVNSSPNFPITKGNFPKPKIGWTVSYASGQLQATVTNVEEYTNYWLLYTNGGNSSIGIPATFTLDANGIFDNVWIKQEFISSSIVSSLNSKTGSYATTGSNTFTGTEIISGSLAISGSSTINGNTVVSSPNLSSVQTITSASYAALTPVSGTLYIIIG